MSDSTVQEVVYSKPKLWKRMTSAIVDLLLFVTVASFLFLGSNAIAEQTDGYQDALTKRLEIQVSSGLYETDGTDILTHVEDETDFPTVRDKKEYLCARIDAFYQNDAFCTSSDIVSYESRKSSAVEEGTMLFVLNDAGELIENPSASLDALYSFYCDEISLHATALLFSSVEYANLTRYFTMVMGIGILVVATIAYFLIYLLFPLVVFRKGRMTLGRALFHIGMIGVDALTPKAGKFVGRCVFTYFVYLLLSFVSFLIPIVISVGMMFMSKRNQDLADYVFNLYMVDASKRDVYMDFDDYLDHQQARESASIENANFKIDNHGV